MHMNYSFSRRYTGPIRAVIFDWAGTTVDHGCFAPAGVFVQAFAKHGMDITVEQARGPMGTHKRVHVATVAQLPKVAAQFRAVKGRELEDADIEAVYQDAVTLQVACLADYATPITGTQDVVSRLRARGIKIGSCSGYVREMMEVLVPAAKAQGYEPDVWVSASEVPAARPSPLMALLNLQKLNVWPVEACVKVGDTVTDVEEGLNAGMWSVAVAMTGNEVGLTEAELAALAPAEREQRRARATEKLAQAGAHYVVDSIRDLPTVLDRIEARLRAGDRP